ncbi:MAG: metallophosphoesterase family protein [Filifactor alocis]|nr:metallophosphoesterase family protein [Filifactor alocis]
MINLTEIAVFSDTHGNLPALKAVLEDIKKRRISEIYCLGDFVGKGPTVNETIDLCRTHCTRAVLGNWDDFLLYSPRDEMPIRWYRNRISKENEAYLRSLPRVFDFYLSGKVVRLYHAHPFDVYKRLYKFDDPSHIEEMFDFSLKDEEFSIKKKADIAGYGDIHHAYLKDFGGRFLFNTGSLGNPLDSKDPSYVILRGELHDDRPSSYSLEFVRVPYDIEQTVADVRNTDMPSSEDYIFEIRTGKFRMLRKK